MTADRDPLVGLCYTSTGGTVGQILARVEPGWYLVTRLPLLDDQSLTKSLVPIESMRDWSLHDIPVARAPTEEKVETWLETAFSIVDAMAKAELQKAPLRTLRQIHIVIGGSKMRCGCGLSHGCKQGWLTQDAHGMYKLTEAGRQLAEERARVPDTTGYCVRTEGGGSWV